MRCGVVCCVEWCGKRWDNTVPVWVLLLLVGVVSLLLGVVSLLGVGDLLVGWT